MRRTSAPSSAGAGRSGKDGWYAMRKVLLVLMLATAVGPLLAQPPRKAAGLTDTSASPHAKLRSVGLGDVRWTRGFWAERFETCRKGSIPHLWHILRGTKYSQFYHNFRIAAGQEK